jgi:hypothetical protein
VQQTVLFTDIKTTKIQIKFWEQPQAICRKLSAQRFRLGPVAQSLQINLKSEISNFKLYG